MLVVNTNVSALKAQRELSRTRMGLSEAMERISSGVRLNSAKDDAVGVGISQRLTSHIKGLSMAMQNANDGIGFLQTAEGALQEVTNLMQQMREMAVQATNAANNTADISSMQARIVELNAEVTRIAEQTELNGRKLLNGDIVNAEFQVGIRADQTLKVSISSATAVHIGNYSTSTNGIGLNAMGAARLSDFKGEALSNLVQPQTLNIHGFSSSSAGTDILVDFEESARAIADKVNLQEHLTGVSSFAKTRLTMEDIFNQASGLNTQSVSFNLYGANRKGINPNEPTSVLIQSSITRDVVGKVDFSGLIAAINTQTIKTGITATEISTGKIELIQQSGENISIERFQNASGEDQGTGVPLDDILTITGFEGTPPVTLQEGQDFDSVTVGGIVTFNSYSAFTVTSDVLFDDSLFQQGFDGFLQGAEFSSLADINFLKSGGASFSLQVVTSGLDFISSLRGELGALQNRFESTIANLGSVRENAEAARSRIEDADFAQETAKLTKAQILQEAGIAILAQANTIPQAVLALLRA